MVLRAVFVSLAATPTLCPAQLCRSEWRSEGPLEEFSGVVTASAILSPRDGHAGALYVAGSFTQVNGQPLARVARWTGSGWDGFGAGPEFLNINGLAVYDFGYGGDSPAILVASGTRDYVLGWEGSRWRVIGSNLGFSPAGMRVLPTPDGTLAVWGGTWGEMQVPRLAIWGGADWTILPRVGDFARVCCAGAFDFDGPGPAPPRVLAGSSDSRVFAWDGWTWSRVGDRVFESDTSVSAILTFDLDGRGPAPERLVAVTQRNVAVWDGSVWTTIAVSPGAACAHVFDPDGCGPSPSVLVIGGNFTEYAGVPSTSVVGFDGQRWFPIGTPGVLTLTQASSLGTLRRGEGMEGNQLVMTGRVLANRQYGRTLFYGCRPTPGCPADFNADGFVDCFDYFDFIACFEGEACPDGRSADFNADGFADFLDVDSFIAAFETGCDPGLHRDPPCD